MRSSVKWRNPPVAKVPKVEFVPLVKQVPKTQIREVQKQARCMGQSQRFALLIADGGGGSSGGGGGGGGGAGAMPCDCRAFVDAVVVP
eukprot:Skav214803  [mRNA]  locus=scaffold740:174080:175056:- [translate_table: standard]